MLDLPTTYGLQQFTMINYIFKPAQHSLPTQPDLLAPLTQCVFEEELPFTTYYYYHLVHEDVY